MFRCYFLKKKMFFTSIMCWFFQDRDALMKLLTFESVEEEVKKRVAKKAMVFGQEVTLNNDDNKGKYKVDPSVVSRLYGDWIIPLTKLVQVEYLLRRLDWSRFLYESSNNVMEFQRIEFFLWSHNCLFKKDDFEMSIILKASE